MAAVPDVRAGPPQHGELITSLRQARAELSSLATSHARLLEDKEILRAIRHGEVDALVVSSPPGARIFTLSGADRPYRVFVENMQEGAATVSGDGVVLFANQRLGDLLGCPVTNIVAHQITEFIAVKSAPQLSAAIGSGDLGATLDVELRRPDGTAVAALAGVSRLEVDGERLTCLTFTDLTNERSLKGEVGASHQRFEALYRGAPVPAYTWQHGSCGLVLIDHNDAAAGLSGGTIAEALGRTAQDYYRDDPTLLGHLNRCHADQVVVEVGRVRRAGGELPEQHLHLTMVPVPPDLVVVHTQDVTESWFAERALRTSEERYRTIVENAQEGISILDADGYFTFANARTAALLGYDAGTLTGMKASTLVDAFTTSGPATPDPTGSEQHEVTARRRDGTLIKLLVSTAPILLSGSGRPGSLCMMSDVSGLRHAEEELAHWALHDVLTGLPNRSLLVDRLDQALARASRQPGTVAALFCDVDEFKQVNDSLGHHVGDEVLKAVATRLRMAVRPSDTVARMGGDEFVVLAEGLTDESVAFGIASRVLTSVEQPLDVGGHHLSVSVSVGVAFAVSDDGSELLRNADAAMYLAKQRGRNRAELFDEELRKVAAERISLIADLRHAVAREELRVHYQPVFTLDGEQLLGVEALVRWQHPERGLIFPDAFIPAAESANLIGDIGAWVLQASCRQAALWAHAGDGRQPLHMAVNVSARQLARGGGLVQLVTNALQSTGIDPFTLVLEVTESAVMDDAEATLAILTELKALGVRLAIDDFGTGYSSLIYLKRFPVDQLKVDRAFVGGLDDDPDDSAIVASVVGLARAVGIVSIAEGVETAKQLAALQRLGCGFGQGYLWSRPRPAAELDELMKSGALSTPRPRTSSDNPVPFPVHRT